MPKRSASEPVPEPIPPSLRAQVLIAEHSSLASARASTQSEVLARIGMLLTLLSAVLVTLALVGQATDFDATFRILAVSLLAIATAIGLLTLVRVTNVAMEDLAFVLGMNRLRAAYVELVPGIEEHLLTGTSDDPAGVGRSYYPLGRRGASQVLGSSMLFVDAVVATLAGLLVASVVIAAGGGLVLAVPLGVVAAAIVLGVAIGAGYRMYRDFWRSWTPRHPAA